MSKSNLNRYFYAGVDLARDRSRSIGRPLPRREVVAFALFLRTINGLERLLPGAS